MEFQKPALVAEQRQTLSPQMIQSIKLMALPLVELKQQIQQELETNPALEVVDDRSTVSLDSLDSAPERESSDESGGLDPFENSSDPGYASSSNYDDDSKRMFIEGAISRSETLQEHLLWQLRLQPLDAQSRDLGEAIIQNLDDDGFHKVDPYTLRAAAPRAEVDRMLGLIRAFEPQGTACANYRESLQVQARLSDRAPDAALQILDSSLDLLEKAKNAEIQKRLRLSDKDMEEALAFIKGLQPFPGREYSSEEPHYVLPDLLVKLKDGDFVIVLNDEEIPLLGIDPFFNQLANDKEKGKKASADGKPADKATDAYVRENIKQAKFFIHSIRQRNETLLKVARAIVEFQRDFFANGPKFLAPLTLKDVAGEVGVHETTVSRIAHSKYVQTDWGVYELRYFFTNSISGAGSSGSHYSKEGVKEVIREIIGSENAALSDRDIMETLSKRGIKLARRTVAKYRSELELDSSFGRKRT